MTIYIYMYDIYIYDYIYIYAVYINICVYIYITIYLINHRLTIVMWFHFWLRFGFITDHRRDHMSRKLPNKERMKQEVF